MNTLRVVTATLGEGGSMRGVGGLRVLGVEVEWADGNDDEEVQTEAEGKVEIGTVTVVSEGQEPVCKESNDNGEVCEDPEHNYQQVQADQGVLCCWG